MLVEDVGLRCDVCSNGPAWRAHVWCLAESVVPVLSVPDVVGDVAVDGTAVGVAVSASWCTERAAVDDGVLTASIGGSSGEGSLSVEVSV